MTIHTGPVSKTFSDSGKNPAGTNDKQPISIKSGRFLSNNMQRNKPAKTTTWLAAAAEVIMDPEQLILEVQKRPFLYDLGDDRYKLAPKRHEAFEEIGKLFGVEGMNQANKYLHDNWCTVECSSVDLLVEQKWISKNCNHSLGSDSIDWQIHRFAILLTHAHVTRSAIDGSMMGIPKLIVDKLFAVTITPTELPSSMIGHCTYMYLHACRLLFVTTTILEWMIFAEW